MVRYSSAKGGPRRGHAELAEQFVAQRLPQEGRVVGIVVEVKRRNAVQLLARHEPVESDLQRPLVPRRDAPVVGRIAPQLQPRVGQLRPVALDPGFDVGELEPIEIRLEPVPFVPGRVALGGAGRQHGQVRGRRRRRRHQAGGDALQHALLGGLEQLPLFGSDAQMDDVDEIRVPETRRFRCFRAGGQREGQAGQQDKPQSGQAFAHNAGRRDHGWQCADRRRPRQDWRRKSVGWAPDCSITCSSSVATI